MKHLVNVVGAEPADVLNTTDISALEGTPGGNDQGRAVLCGCRSPTVYVQGAAQGDTATELFSRRKHQIYVVHKFDETGSINSVKTWILKIKTEDRNAS
ncbi:hypothetical protein NQ318_019022 [Aromia moschata]|uniref:Uncharacterized protein n=1 Tax=Aromia moschata TaxID=1265417 RepID=A0AAV8Y0Y2_9CUCU|nr:hypothetical protein NQ318_019022 [Aromia moschata]